MLLLLTLAWDGLQEVPTAWRFGFLCKYFHVYLGRPLLPYPTGVGLYFHTVPG
jgi:hypothetical protein